MGVSVAEWLLLLGAGLVAGVINSVASGGSFFTYPAFLLIGLAPIAAATTRAVSAGARNRGVP